MEQDHPEELQPMERIQAEAGSKCKEVQLWTDHNPPITTIPVLFRADKVEEWGEQ